MLVEERDSLTPLLEPHARWKQLARELESAETDQAEDLIRSEMDSIKVLFGVTVTDPNPRLWEIEEELSRSSLHKEELARLGSRPFAQGRLGRCCDSVAPGRAVAAGCRRRRTSKRRHEEAQEPVAGGRAPSFSRPGTRGG